MPAKLFDGSFRGPGRPKGSVSGRAQALLTLDKVLAEADSQAALEAAFRAELAKSPFRFFRQIIMPLLPREAILTSGDTGPKIVRWVSLLESSPHPESKAEQPAIREPGM